MDWWQRGKLRISALIILLPSAQDFLSVPSKGGTKIGKGVVLGRRGVYPEGKDCDGNVGGCKGGGDPIVEGGLWIARYKIIWRRE